MSICSKTGCHAVLAPLSGCYPPLEGRSPTCYSPVRHSTQGRSPFRVRLACVRHAASVDSEPGSNSQVKVVAIARIAANAGDTFNVDRLLIGSLALLLIYSWSNGQQFLAEPHTVGLNTRQVFVLARSI